MPRTVLVHLNVEVPDDDSRTANQVADAVMDAITVGSDHSTVRELTIVCPLAEEV